MASNAEASNTKSRKLVWDHDSQVVFIELCLDEIKNGNRPGASFNKIGWTNLGNNLKERLGKEYTKTQIKNHWDSMKKDWKLFDRLMRLETGLGWNAEKKTIDATPEWWDEKIKADPALAKFKDKNLEIYHRYYAQLFQDCVATGARAKTPADFANGISSSFDMWEEGSGDSDERISIGSPESSAGRKKKAARQYGRALPKKGRRSDLSSAFETRVDTVLQALSARSTATFPPPPPTIKECMDIVSEWPGFESGSNDLSKAAIALMDRNAREAFMFFTEKVDKMIFLYELLNGKK